MSNQTVQAAVEGMPVFRSPSAALEALLLAGSADTEQPNLIEAFVETCSEAEVQAIGTELDARADRNSLVALLDGMSPEERSELLAEAYRLARKAAPEFLTLRADPDALRHLSIREACQLSDALRTVRDVTAGLCCQPRFQGEQRGSYNAAGDILEGVDLLLSGCLTELRKELDRRAPANAEEAKLRAEHIVLDQAHVSDDLDELAKVFGSLGLTAVASSEAAPISANIAIAIERHRAALQTMDEVGRTHDERASVKRDRPGDSDAAAMFAEAESAFYAACDLEQSAHNALLALPIQSLADMRTKAAYLASVADHMIHDTGTMATLLASMADFEGRA